MRTPWRLTTSSQAAGLIVRSNSPPADAAGFQERGNSVAVVTFRRPARREPPPMLVSAVEVRSPPALPERQTAGVSTWLMVLPGAGRARCDGADLHRRRIRLRTSPPVCCSASPWSPSRGASSPGRRRPPRQIAAARRDYLRHLGQIRRRPVGRRRPGRRCSGCIPHPQGLQSLVRTSRLWERRPADPDFATVRLGLGDQAARPSTCSVGEPSHRTTSTLCPRSRWIGCCRHTGTVRGLPVALSLRSLPGSGLRATRSPAGGWPPRCCCRRSPGTRPPNSAWALCARRRSDRLRPGTGSSGPRTWPIPSRATRPPCPVRRRGGPGRLEELLADELAGRPWATANSDPLGGPQPHPGDHRRRRGSASRRPAGRGRTACRASPSSTSAAR